MSHPKRPRPLIPSDSCKTIPISIVLDGVEIMGEIVFLNSTDLQVAILSPGVGVWNVPARPVVRGGMRVKLAGYRNGYYRVRHTQRKDLAQGAERLRPRATIWLGHRQNRGGRNVDGHLSGTTTVTRAPHASATVALGLLSADEYRPTLAAGACRVRRAHARPAGEVQRGVAAHPPGSVAAGVAVDAVEGEGVRTVPGTHVESR